MTLKTKLGCCLAPVILTCGFGGYVVWTLSYPPHPSGYDALLAAIDRHDATAVRSMLDHGVNPNVYPNSNADLMLEDDITLLNDAVDEGDVEIISILLDHGADPNLGDGWHVSPLAAATEKEDTEIMTLLIEHGAKVNDDGDGSSALWRAAMDGKEKAVKFLLDHGANPNTRMHGYDGQRLLNALQTVGRSSEIERILREHGANE